jgi:hypothetical protein
MILHLLPLIFMVFFIVAMVKISRHVARTPIYEELYSEDVDG